MELLHREVALKLLSPRFTGDPYHTRRFQQEARDASALNHPRGLVVAACASLAAMVAA